MLEYCSLNLVNDDEDNEGDDDGDDDDDDEQVEFENNEWAR